MMATSPPGRSQGEVRPPGGAAQPAQWASVGAKVLPPGHPQGEVRPPRGAAQPAQRASVGAKVSPPGRSQGEVRPPPGAAQPAQRASVAAPMAPGFTLVEVLVALAITAIALMAGMQAISALTRNADRQGQVLLAQICAENELIRTKLAGELPGVGSSSTACQQGGAVLDVVRKVQPTPNPNFRRVDASVSQAGTPILQVSTIVGRW